MSNWTVSDVVRTVLTGIVVVALFSLVAGCIAVASFLGQPMNF